MKTKIKRLHGLSAAILDFPLLISSTLVVDTRPLEIPDPENNMYGSSRLNRVAIYSLGLKYIRSGVYSIMSMKQLASSIRRQSWGN